MTAIGSNGYLDLAQDLAALTSVVYVPQGAVSGETWAQNVDFWVRPYNAAADAKPYLGLEMKRRFMSPLLPAMRRSIQVTAAGLRHRHPGRCLAGDDLPPRWSVEPLAGIQHLGGLVRTEDTGVSRLYGDDPLKGERAAWETAFEDAVKRYQRFAL